MVIGENLDYIDLYTASQAAESKLRCKVNPLFLRREDWRRTPSFNRTELRPVMPTLLSLRHRLTGYTFMKAKWGPFSKLKIVPNASGA